MNYNHLDDCIYVSGITRPAEIIVVVQTTMHQIT